MKSAVIFDLDGTLIDTPRGIVETYKAALKSMDVEFDDLSAIRATIGLPLPKAFSIFLQLAADDPRVAYAMKQYQTLFKSIVLPKARELVFPGVVEGLAELKSQGFALAVATSKVFTSAEALIKAAGLWEQFDLVVGADQVKQPKPHPEMGHFTMEQLGTLPGHTIMVGDTTHDLLMARDAGMRSIAVTYGVHDVQELKSGEPTWIVNTFGEVVQCCIDHRAALPDNELVVNKLAANSF
jgi:phosphoglycolate phosphatase